MVGSRTSSKSRSKSCVSCNGARIRHLGWARRMTAQIQKYDLSQPASAGGNFWTKHLDKYLCMASDGKLTAKQFRDDINSLREFDEGDDFVRELNGDVRRQTGTT